MTVTVVIRFPDRAKHTLRYRLAEPGEILELTTGPERRGWTQYRVVHADLEEIEIEPVKERNDERQGDPPGDAAGEVADG